MKLISNIFHILAPPTSSRRECSCPGCRGTALACSGRLIQVWGNNYLLYFNNLDILLTCRMDVWQWGVWRHWFLSSFSAPPSHPQQEPPPSPGHWAGCNKEQGTVNKGSPVNQLSWSYLGYVFMSCCTWASDLPASLRRLWNQLVEAALYTGHQIRGGDWGGIGDYLLFIFSPFSIPTLSTYRL